MRETNLEIARRWLAAFNAHDVTALVALYAKDARHTSPKIRALHPETQGQLVGKAALAAWWRDANRRLPNLRYEATAIVADRWKTSGLDSRRRCQADTPSITTEPTTSEANSTCR